MNAIDRALERAQLHAPYLAESLNLFPEIAALLQSHSPQDICHKLYAGLPHIIRSLDEEMSELRRLKRQIHLITAIADLAEIWDWVEVTGTLTQLADICMSRILYAAVTDQGMNPVAPDNPLPGLFILGIGKIRRP